MAAVAGAFFTSIGFAAAASFPAGIVGLVVGNAGVTVVVVVVVFDGFGCVCLPSDSILTGTGVLVVLDLGVATVAPLATAAKLPAAGTTFFSTLTLSFLTSSTFTPRTFPSSALAFSALTLFALPPSPFWTFAMAAAMILANSTGFGLFTFAAGGATLTGSGFTFAVGLPTFGTNEISTDDVKLTLFGGVVRTGFVLLRGVCLVRGKIPAVDGDIFCTGDRLTDGCAVSDDAVDIAVRELGEMCMSRDSADDSDVEFIV